MSGGFVHTIEKRSEFLDSLARTGNVTQSCDEVKLARKTVYEWRHADPDFATAWEAAQEMGTDWLEDVGVDRGVAGKSDTMLIFMLKGRRPDKYKDRVWNEHTGLGGGPIMTTTLDLSRLDTARLRELAVIMDEVEGRTAAATAGEAGGDGE